MDDQSRKDIRRILKTFGIKADEALVAHLARNEGIDSIQVSITLEDLTDYGNNPPKTKLALTIEDTIQR